MTRWSLPAALYDVFIDYPEICRFPAVQALIGQDVPPWSEESPLPLWTEHNMLEAVVSFNRRYVNLQKEQRIRLLGARAVDATQEGRDAVMVYFRDVIRRWKVREQVQTCLTELGMEPYALIRANNSREVRSGSCTGRSLLASDSPPMM